jgi:hypothetical protein
MKSSPGKRSLATAVPVFFMIVGIAHGQPGLRFGIAPSASTATVAVPMTSRPLVLIRSHPVYYPASQNQGAPRTVPATGGPYVTGRGQWVPTGAQLDVIRFETEPGYTAATPASASGHWDWRRATMADLVELSRRNKAARGEN